MGCASMRSFRDTSSCSCRLENTQAHAHWHSHMQRPYACAAQWSSTPMRGKRAPLTQHGKREAVDKGAQDLVGDGAPQEREEHSALDEAQCSGDVGSSRGLGGPHHWCMLRAAWHLVQHCTAGAHRMAAGALCSSWAWLRAPDWNAHSKTYSQCCHSPGTPQREKQQTGGTCGKGGIRMLAPLAVSAAPAWIAAGPGRGGRLATHRTLSCMREGDIGQM